ncbi:putative lysozyme [Aromatoleum aromaticum EbN1]|uniref:Lysozyme n=1 Tax=Aromatoleum aromaticum (strain DSM 19018 / LMG 30748 / EbN1) TaxID=76114 RepID=Q5NXH3_AROAE|nr:glycoside hydrolase family 19 protein [Aromatoleum aromaticum]CAI10241.1 putative lysozyme [Aromatoleum aromaticum EbN1]
MMLVTPQQLIALYRCPIVRATAYAPFLDDAMWSEGIVTPARIRAFLAQIGHESARLAYVREIWGPTPAQRRYEGRRDLGNTEPGDGKRYLGRGLIQITGRANYQAATAALGEDFITYPGLLETPKWACLSAAGFWSSRDLNALADAGDFDAITQRVNGGQTGRAERIALHQAAAAVIA